MLIYLSEILLGLPICAIVTDTPHVLLVGAVTCISCFAGPQVCGDY